MMHTFIVAFVTTSLGIIPSFTSLYKYNLWTYVNVIVVSFVMSVMNGISM